MRRWPGESVEVETDAADSDGSPDQPPDLLAPRSCLPIPQQKKRSRKKPGSEAARDGKGADKTKNHRAKKIEGPPKRRCDPETCSHGRERQEEADLKTPKQVLPLQWGKEQDVGSEQKPMTRAGVPPAADLRHAPKVQRANTSQDPDHEKRDAHVPVGELREAEREQAREGNPMLVMEGEEVGQAESARLHLFEEQPRTIPFIQPRCIHSVAIN